MNIHSVPPMKPEHRPTSDKKDLISAAALELFVERGFFGTVVPDIAAHAGVGAGTIYRYFESKEALVNAIYQQEKLKFAQVVIEDFPMAAPTREQFRVLFMRMAKFTTANPKSFIFLELHHHARYLDEASRAVEARTMTMVEAVVRQAQARRDLKSCDPRLLLGIVMGAFVGIVRSALEIEQPLEKVDWAVAEQCLWEAVRS
ncbi:MAG TPA: TetR/AcrR family transcriptional regulator [Kofleriaceae bacterium]|nr:TetR/AcrR family transcriptional regulator [Kofleriaceae bacterium]